MATQNFYFLFAGLIVLLGAEPLLQGAPEGPALVQLAFTSVLVVGVFSLAADRRAFRLGLALAAFALATALGYAGTGAPALRVLDLAAIACFCVLAIGVSLRQVVFAPGDVTLNSVVGGLCVYLLLGVLFAILFGFVSLVEPAAFRVAEDSDSRGEFLYFSFVTLTTLGYGDITPVHPLARTLAYLEAVTGQLYVAVLVAGLVGRHVANLRSGA